METLPQRGLKLEKTSNSEDEARSEDVRWRVSELRHLCGVGEGLLKAKKCELSRLTATAKAIGNHIREMGELGYLFEASTQHRKAICIQRRLTGMVERLDASSRWTAQKGLMSGGR